MGQKTICNSIIVDEQLDDTKMAAYTSSAARIHFNSDLRVCCICFNSHKSRYVVKGSCAHTTTNESRVYPPRMTSPDTTRAKGGGEGGEGGRGGEGGGIGGEGGEGGEGDGVETTKNCTTADVLNPPSIKLTARL